MSVFEDYIEIKTSKNAFAGLLGIRPLEMREGYARGEMDFRPSFGNSMGTAHGGVIFSLADTVSGLAAASYGFQASTVSASMNYLKAGKNPVKLSAEANTVKHGKTLSVIEVEVTDDKGALLAKGTFTYYNLGIPLVKED